MSRKRYTPEQIIGILRKAEVVLAPGRKVAEMCRGLGVPDQTYYRWRKEYGGMTSSQSKRPKDLAR